MPLENFHDQTFVAFTDISGFKQLMATEESATAALSWFYEQGYTILRRQAGANPHVEGMLVSDCAVLWVTGPEIEQTARLRALLDVVQQLNRKMLERNYMLTTSIAFGYFVYSAREEFVGIEKNLMHGAPYLAAYRDQSAGTPRLDPGQCRILHQNLAGELVGPLPNDPILGLLKPPTINAAASYFYWMCPNSEAIAEFNSDYRDSYNLKYRGMLHALWKATRRGEPERH